MSTARTLFDRIWENHVVAEEPGAPAILYIDLHLVHEVTSPQAFAGLKARGLKVRRPDRTVGTLDHGIPTDPERRRLLFVPGAPGRDEQAAAQMALMGKNCEENGVRLFGLDSDKQGVVHVIGPENGFTQPGMTVVCGDSHTSTHGAFGALAFGIGTSEVEHVLGTQCLLQNKPKTMRVTFEGKLRKGVTSKDMILALIAKIGAGGGTGYVIEFTGDAVKNLDMEARMTLCNMSIEAGARAGMIAPDEVTFEYVKGREFAPKGEAWDLALARWKQLVTDPGAKFDAEISLRADEIEPMITFGTNPGQGIPLGGTIPRPEEVTNVIEREALEKALRYMDLTPGSRLLGHKIDVVFIGSCTNGRLTDLRQAASVLKGRKVKDGVRVLVVPGSHEVKRKAEAEGLDAIFRAAGAEWREPGCSMCIAMNGDEISAGQYAVSSSNRNFEGRQGKGGRTLLASPLTCAASAVAGVVADARTFI